MPDLLGPPGDPLVSWLLTYLLHSTVLVAGAAAIGHFILRTPAHRDSLGKAVLVVPVLTATLALVGSGTESVLALVGSGTESVPWETLDEAGSGHAVDGTTLIVRGAAQWTPDRSATTTRSRVDGPVEALITQVHAVDPQETMLSAEVACVETALRRVVGAEAAGGIQRRTLARNARSGAEGVVRCLGLEGSRRRASWTWFVLVPWLAGGLVGMVRLGRSAVRIRAVRGTLGVCSPRALRLARALGSTSGGRSFAPLRMRSSAALDTPCVLPGGTVVLTARAEEELDDPQLRAVIAHEAGHVARRDAWWFAGLETLGALLWVQPLNRIVLGALRDNAELACDDWAVARVPDATDLARSITTISGWAVAPTPSGAMPILRAGRGPAERVRRLVHGERGRSGPSWVAIPALALLIVPALLLPAVSLPGAAERVFLLADGGRIELRIEDEHATRRSDGTVEVVRTRVLMYGLEPG